MDHSRLPESYQLATIDGADSRLPESYQLVTVDVAAAAGAVATAADAPALGGGQLPLMRW